MSDDCSKYINSEDCYIYVDDQEQKVRMQCVECHKKNGLGEHWRAVNGYGPWDIDCFGCGRAIHKFQDKQAANTNLDS